MAKVRAIYLFVTYCLHAVFSLIIVNWSLTLMTGIVFS